MQTRFADDMLDTSHPARTIERPFYPYIYIHRLVYGFMSLCVYKIHMEIWACLDVEYASAATYTTKTEP